MSTTITGAKPHYMILDGLRGVAALMVVIFHIFEAHATSHLDQIVNHGYLAVDFFFLLSGFVIGYAYDDRWQVMSKKDFFKRRLVRLQPMVIMGMIVGAVCFYFQESPLWPSIGGTPFWYMLLVMLIGCTLIPVPLSMDIRGWGEMHPLNGPGWSLFYEYIANIIYALFLKNISRTILAILTIIAGAVLIHFSVTSPSGDVIGGWSINAEQLRIGFTRVSFPFLAGLLLCRSIKIKQVNNAFLWSGLLLVIMLAMPRIGGSENLWANGLYDSLAIIIVFPVIIYIGAGGSMQSNAGRKVCKFFGDISYPIYITHYPLVYTYTAWVSRNKPSFEDAFPIAIATIAFSVLLAYGCLKLYDEPVRKWLNAKFIVKK